MTLTQPAAHIKDLITVYENMPYSRQRELVLQALRLAYLYATSDELAAINNKQEVLQNGRHSHRR